MREEINSLLDSWGQFLGLDIRYFSKNSLFLISRQLVVGLSGFALTSTLAHQFSKYTFGEYNLVLSFLGLLSIFSLPGMMRAILDSVVRGFDQSLIEGTKLRFKSSFFSIPIFLILAYFYFVQEKPTISLLLILSLSPFPLFYTFKTYEVFLIAKEKFARLFWTACFASLIPAAVVIGTTLIFRKIYLTFLSFIMVNSLLDFSFYLQNKKAVKKKAKTDPEMEKFGYFLTLTSLVSLIVDSLDKMVLGFFAGFASIAIFSVANLLPQFIEKSLYALQAVFIPKIIKQGKKRNLETIKKHLIKIIFLSILIFLLIFFISPLFIKIFFGFKYQESIRLAQILSISLIFFLSSEILSQMMTFQKRKKSTLFFSLYPALPKMALYLLLIPRFGIWGLVVSLVVSRILGFIGLLWVNLK